MFLALLRPDVAARNKKFVSHDLATNVGGFFGGKIPDGPDSNKAEFPSIGVI